MDLLLAPLLVLQRRPDAHQSFFLQKPDRLVLRHSLFDIIAVSEPAAEVFIFFVNVGDPEPCGVVRDRRMVLKGKRLHRREIIEAGIPHQKS